MRLDSHRRLSRSRLVISYVSQGEWLFSIVELLYVLWTGYRSIFHHLRIITLTLRLGTALAVLLLIQSFSLVKLFFPTSRWAPRTSPSCCRTAASAACPSRSSPTGWTSPAPTPPPARRRPPSPSPQHRGRAPPAGPRVAEEEGLGRPRVPTRLPRPQPRPLRERVSDPQFGVI